MKTSMHLRGRAAMRVNPQQIAFELKHRVVIALKKLADRDTFQIGNEELERIAEGLTPEGVVPFLSCVTETDQEQKTAVRKECVRIMGTLARFHGEMLGPHLGKMIGSIVKRLKDQDSAVKDACVETIGILASNFSNCGAESGGPFSALVKPLFEALGEQNKQVQSGSALCLARVIDNTIDPPAALLMRILMRTIKLLKSQHVMAKPALIELIRSIIQAGGASTQLALSAAINSIQETLKSNDWTTRKAASAALAGIAADGGSMLDSFKASCILSLESCRFDKVKPVRDSVMQAIHYWKSLPGTDYPEYSEAGSSTKENFYGGNCTDLTDASYGGWKGNPLGNISSCSAISSSPMSLLKRRTPLAVRKTYLNHEQITSSSKSNDWHIGITLPKIASMADACNEESQGSCITKTFEQIKKTAMRALDSGYEYGTGVDDKPECSSTSDIVSGNFETKEVTAAHGYIEEDDSTKVIGMNDQTPDEENYVKSHTCSQTVQDHKSLDSTVTDVSSRGFRVCCLHSTNELAFIRQKLLEIDTKQSNLLDLVQVQLNYIPSSFSRIFRLFQGFKHILVAFTADGNYMLSVVFPYNCSLQVFIGNSLDGLSALHSKVLGLEHMVGRMAQDVSHNQNYFNMVPSKQFRNNQNVSSSPRFSNCTPRPSVDSNYRASPLSVRCRELWDETTVTKSRPNTSTKPSDFCREPTRNVVKNPIFKRLEKNVGDGLQSNVVKNPIFKGLEKNVGDGLRSRRNFKLSNAGDCADFVKKNLSEHQNRLWKHIKDFLSTGDLEYAFLEALCCGDVFILIELMNRTGPVLEQLSHQTAGEILSTIASQLLEPRFLDSIIPWLHQVVDLSTKGVSNYFLLSPKAKREFLSAIQEMAAADFANSVDKRSIAELALQLQLLWMGERKQGKCKIDSVR